MAFLAATQPPNAGADALPEFEVGSPLESVVATPGDISINEKKPKPKPDCLDGTRYDDGKLENGIRSSLFDDNIVMLFEAPSYPARIDKICIAWLRTSFWKGIYFDVRIWSADGPDGAPGRLLYTVPGLTATKIPTRAKFYNYDTSKMDLIVDGPVYIGPFWDPIEYFLIYLGMDTGPKTPVRRGYHNVGIFDDQPPHTALGPDSSLFNYRAIGVRVKFTPIQ